MNTLCMGLPFGISLELARRFRSGRGHEVRTLAIDDPADYHFNAEETAAEVIARIGREWRVDTLFCWVPELFPPPRDVEACPCRTVAAISDWNLYFPQLEYNLARFDVVLSDKLGAQSLRLPYTTPAYVGSLYSHDTEYHFREAAEPAVDILFAGNLNPRVHVERGRILERVASLADRWRVHFTSGLDAPEYRKALNAARIVVNYGLRHEMNLRCFEAPACGALLFMEADNLEIRDLFQEGEHFVAYDEDTLCARLEHFLKHDEERRRVAEQGWQRVQELAGEHRLDDMLDGVEASGAGVRPFRYLDDRRKRLAECMLYASSQVPSQRQLARSAAQDAASEFPEDPALATARALIELDFAAEAPREDRAALVQSILHDLQHVTAVRPEAAVPWLNLAFACRRSNVPASEARFLELALETTSADMGGLLLGAMDDPYYVAWRRALATGDAAIPLLHARAHARLAEILLGQGDYRGALAHADAARECAPEIAPAYRVAGRASLDLGMPEHAADVLRDGLRHSAFDAEMRLALVHALHDSGDREALRAIARESARLFGCSPKMAHLATMFLEYCD